MTKEYDHIVITMSDGTCYTGQVHLLGHSRIHDLLNNEKEPFLALKGVIKNSGEKVHWILLNKSHIISLEPPTGEESGVFQQPGFTRVLHKGDQPGA
ncbi:MAG: hypothetical protein JXR97_15200 [Planctomycetes bacterium]|nr:hypothetical protein [Planctomycetota bacterium]